jgi:hypothetical protein
MTDMRADPLEAGPTLAEIVELGLRRATVALVIGAGIIGAAIYARPGPPTYEAFEVNGEVVRLNRRNGSLVVCDKVHCQIIYRAGSRIGPRPQAKALPKPAVPTPPAAAPAAER